MKKNKDIKILVATHKPYVMPDDKMYIPIHVGADGKKEIGFLGDNTGDNISSKNLNYCELTGMYWAWKNLKCDIIGVMHYRRYLSVRSRSEIKKAKTVSDKYNLILNKNEIIDSLEKDGAIVPVTRLCIKTVYTKYAQQHYSKDLDNVRAIIEDDYPDMLEAFDVVMKERKYAIGNMCVMSKKSFDEYCAWLFELFAKLEKVTDMNGYSILQQRLYGFLSERIFNVWLRYKKMKVKEAHLITLEHDRLPALWNKAWHRILHIKL